MTPKERVINLCKERGVSIFRMEKDLGFANNYIKAPTKGGKLSAERVKMIADYLGVPYHYIDPELFPQDEAYYLNDSAKEIVQFLYDNPEYKILFDAMRGVDKKDILFVKDLIDRMKR